MKKGIIQIALTFVLGLLFSSSAMLLETSTDTEKVAKFNGDTYIYPIGELRVEPPVPPPPIPGDDE